MVMWLCHLENLGLLSAATREERKRTQPFFSLFLLYTRNDVLIASTDMWPKLVTWSQPLQPESWEATVSPREHLVRTDTGYALVVSWSKEWGCWCVHWWGSTYRKSHFWSFIRLRLSSCVAQAIFELAIACLSLLTCEIVRVHHHVQFGFVLSFSDWL